MAEVPQHVKTLAMVAPAMLAIAMADAPDLPTRRWRLFLKQYEDEYGHGWQTQLAAKLHLDTSTINKQAKGERGPSRKTMQLAVEVFGIDPGFFSDVTLGPAPVWTDHRRTAQRPAAPSAAAVVSMAENRHWRRFLDLAGPDRYGLTDDQIEWLRGAPFRGGVQSVDDYIAAAELIARRDQPHPVGLEEAREAERDRR